MKELIIVTAFFDIGREKSTSYPRTIEQYFEYFRFWARIQNNLIVYCQPQYYEKIYSIREEFGLIEKTKIVPVENIYMQEYEIYQKMCQIEKNEDFLNFRYYNKALSNQAKYDYIMFMKFWAMKEAAKIVESDAMLCWMDFGFNHGGDLYTNSEDFDFLWEFDFPNKVTSFSLYDPEKMCIIDSLQFQKDCFEGWSIIMPSSICSLFYERIKEAMNALLLLECMDDDQQLLLMVYKKYKDMFNIVICDWFEIFIKCSNQKFSIKDKTKDVLQNTVLTKQKKRVSKSLFNKLLWCYRRVRYPDYPEKYESPFILRMKSKQEKYYGQ